MTGLARRCPCGCDRLARARIGWLRKLARAGVRPAGINAGTPMIECSMTTDRVPVCLSIAGSDSGGGAGVQADLKAFARCGVHGTTAITALTAQNTVSVTHIEAVTPAMIEAQVHAVADDFGVAAVKIGMIGGPPAIEAVARALDRLSPGTPVVLDPVMIAESGARLLEHDAQTALRELLLPRATIATPNIFEARVLADDNAGALSAEQLARAVHAAGAPAVVVTGGHRDEVIDVLFDGERVTEILGERYPNLAAHGSGCTHSSALAAHLALGFDLLASARAARAIAADAVRLGLGDLGAGPGPVNVLGVGRGDVQAVVDPAWAGRAMPHVAGRETRQQTPPTASAGTLSARSGPLP